MSHIQPKQKAPRVLVTGAEGFIGSHLVERLLECKYQVRALVLYNSFNSWGWLESLAKEQLDKIEIVLGDIRDPYGIRNAIEGMDIVFHLAALINIPFSYHSPDLYVATNVQGTLNVLQACKDFHTARVLITSTSEVYGSARYVPIDENHPLQGQSPYSASKIGAEKIAESFYASFDTPVVILRPFNTYGPRQSARAVIPSIITQLLLPKGTVEIGALSPTRDFTYVKDVCLAIEHLSRCEEAVGKTINIGSNTEISIGELARMLKEMTHSSAILIDDPKRKRPEKSEVNQLRCDNRLVKDLIGWEQQTSLTKGLELTIDWFRKIENRNRYKADIYNI
jgi:NAD dependent epimerase/dehydratase